MAGTLIVVVLATGSVVVDAKMNGAWGIPFIAFAPFVGVAIGVYMFGRVSMAHFNPAVTLGFLITKHISKLFFLYVVAEITGALLASLFVKTFLEPMQTWVPIPRTTPIRAPGIWGGGFGLGPADGRDNGGRIHKRLEGFWRDSHRGMMGLDIIFLTFISGSPFMNPAHSLAPALMRRVTGSLCI